MDTLSVRRPRPKISNIRKKEENWKNSSKTRKKERVASANKKIGHALKTRQSHSIEYWVSKIVPQRYFEGNKSSVVLRGSGPRRCISIPFSEQITVCNTH